MRHVRPASCGRSRNGRAGYDFAGWRFSRDGAIRDARALSPAGQHDWEVTGLARSWLAKVPLTQLPRLLVDIAYELGGGFAPLGAPSISMPGGPPRCLILKAEAERSYLRIAECLPLQPELRGLMAYSWFYSTAVREVSPQSLLGCAIFFRPGTAPPSSRWRRRRPITGFMIGSAQTGVPSTRMASSGHG